MAFFFALTHGKRALGQFGRNVKRLATYTKQVFRGSIEGQNLEATSALHCGQAKDNSQGLGYFYVDTTEVQYKYAEFI